MTQAAAIKPSHRREEAVIGGPGSDGVYRWSYSLGCARDSAGGWITRLVKEVPGVAGMTFEADNFDHAFRRALAISEDMADATGQLRDGVLVTLTEYDNLADIGIDAD